MARKHLVIGAHGMVGSAICKELALRKQELYQFSPCYRIENRQQVIDTAMYVEPDVIWLCAAYTNVTECETDPYAYRVNVEGVANVCEAAQRAGAKIVFFSSSYVFDGNKRAPYSTGDVTCPQSMYGIHKLVGEELAGLVDEYTIIRTCAVYGHDVNRKCFPYQVKDSLATGDEFYAATDQLVAPIHVKELARLSVDASKNPSSIYHINGIEPMSKYEWAVKIAENFASSNRVMGRIVGDPIRPKNGVLSNCFYTQPYHRGFAEFLHDN